MSPPLLVPVISVRRHLFPPLRFRLCLLVFPHFLHLHLFCLSSIIAYVNYSANASLFTARPVTQYSTAITPVATTSSLFGPPPPSASSSLFTSSPSPSSPFAPSPAMGGMTQPSPSYASSPNLARANSLFAPTPSSSLFGPYASPFLYHIYLLYPPIFSFFY